MEISTQLTNSQPAASSVNSSTAQPPVNEQQTQAKEAELNTVSTVNLSPAAQKLAADEPEGTTSSINSAEEAQESVAQFQQDAANDPSLTQAAQSNSLTSTEVQRLIG